MVHSTASPRQLPVSLTAASPGILVSAGGKGLVSAAGAVLLVQVMRVISLDRGEQEAFGQRRVHVAISMNLQRRLAPEVETSPQRRSNIPYGRPPALDDQLPTRADKADTADNRR
jgi:hypothetical protein